MSDPDDSRLQSWLAVLADRDPFTGRERLDAAAALAEWLQSDEATLEQRITITQSLPDRMAMFELGKVLVQVIDSEVPMPLRLAAARSLAVTGNINVLVRLPSSPQPQVRRYVVELLDGIAQERVRREDYWSWHMEQLQSLDPEVLRATLMNLPLHFGRDPEVIAILTEQLGHPEPETRAAAAWGLGLIGEVDILIRNRHVEPDPVVRRIIASYLGRAYTGRREEREALQVMEADSNEEVRKAARKALRAIRRSSA